MKRVYYILSILLVSALVVTAQPVAAVSSGFDVSSAEFNQSVDVSSGAPAPESVFFDDNGSRMYVVSSTSSQIAQFSLSTNYDVSTATFARKYEIGEDGFPVGGAFNDDGTKMYILGAINDDVFEYDLSEAYNVSTATFSQSFNVGANAGDPTDVTFNDDGTKMYISDAAGNDIDEYDLSPGFDVSTATLSNELSISSQSSSVLDVTFNDTGDIMVIVDGDTREVYQYELSTNFDTSSSSFVQSFNVSSQASDPSGLAFNGTGSKMYIADDPSASVYEYDVVGEPPIVDNSGASPTGGLSGGSVTLELPIEDTGFGPNSSSSVDVEFFTDGSSIGTDTITDNGTASIATTFTSGGDHEWNATATDAHGLSTNSNTFSVSIPENLTIREETPPHDKITERVDVIFYENVDDNPTIVNRTTTNGNVSLAGLPVGTEFSVRVSSSNYYNRTVLIRDIFAQDTVFLLRENNSASTVTFTIEDETAQFTSEDASIEVQRAINESLYSSGGFNWLTITGDRTGAANELTVPLEDEVRYRLKVSDGAGETRIVGAYTVVGADVVVLRPTAPGINVTDIDAWTWNATQQNTSTGDQIVFEYADPDDATSDLIVEIHEQGNESNRFVNQTVSGPLGYAKITQSLTAEQAEKNWVVKLYATRDGAQVTDSIVVSKGVIGQLTELAPWIRHAIAITVMVLTLGLFSLINVEAGAVITGFLGMGLGFVGWLPSGAMAAAGVALFIVFGWKIAAQRFA